MQTSDSQMRGPHGLRGAVQRLPRSIVMRVFSCLYVLLALMMIVPPIYEWAGRPSPIVMGLPFSVFYVILNAVLITVLIWLLWLVEGVRGERERFDDVEEGEQK